LRAGTGRFIFGRKPRAGAAQEPVMRHALLAVVVDVIVFSVRRAFPIGSIGLCTPIPCALAAASGRAAWRVQGAATQIGRAAAFASLVAAAALAGSFYAGWREKVRFVDALPAAEEGRDIGRPGLVERDGAAGASTTAPTTAR
jgi:hypothetical protein